MFTCIGNAPISNTKLLLVFFKLRKEIRQFDVFLWQFKIESSSNGIQQRSIGSNLFHKPKMRTLRDERLLFDLLGIIRITSECQLETLSISLFKIIRRSHTFEFSSHKDSQSIAKNICFFHCMCSQKQCTSLLLLIDQLPQLTTRSRIQTC